MRFNRIILGLVAATCLATSGFAQNISPFPKPSPSTLDKVKAQGFLACGGAPRPGLAMEIGGKWIGLEVEICRAIATAALGPNARYTFHIYDSEVDYDGPRAGNDQVSFLSFSEMAQHHLTDKMLPGPTVFVESQDVLVAGSSTARDLRDLAGKGLCFIIGTAAENSVEAWFHAQKLDLSPRAYQEEGEMYDAFNVGRCEGVTAELTTLAAQRRNGGVNHLDSRFLPDHLDAFPILAATPLTADSQWAAIVAWTVDTLITNDARETDYVASGLRAMTVEPSGLGLAAGWQKIVVDQVGNYSAIFARTLGAGSPLKLDPGLNRRLVDGGIFLPPQRN